MLRQALLAAVAAGAMVAALPGQAEAAATYTLTDTVFGPALGVPSTGGTPRTSLTFTVSDAAVSRGSFTLGFVGSGFPYGGAFTGDSADFVDLTVERETVRVGNFFRANPSSLDVAFAPDQSVTSLALRYIGDDHSLYLDPAGGDRVSGRFVSGYNGCAVPPDLCSVTGRVVRADALGPAATDVPEPASLALFGTGLLGVTLVLRRRS